MLIYLERFIYSRADKTKNLQSIVRNGIFYWDKETQAEFDFLRLLALKQIKKIGFFKQGNKTELVFLGAVLVQFETGNQSRIIACAA